LKGQTVSTHQSNLRAPDPRLALRPSPAAGAALASAAANPQLTHFRVRQAYFSKEAAEKFSVGAGVISGGGSASQQSFALLYEALVETEATPVQLGDAQWEQAGAIGVVLQVSVVQLDAEVHFDIFSVAAAVQLGFARAQYAATVFPSSAAALQNLLPPSGDLNLDNFDKLLAGIDAVKNAMGAPGAALVPQLYARPAKMLTSIPTDQQLARTIAFAVRQISKSKYVETALQSATDKGLDPTIVRLVYEAFWPAVQEHQDPPNTVLTAARVWIADQGL
jgi:hypothetical protein